MINNDSVVQEEETEKKKISKSIGYSNECPEPEVRPLIHKGESNLTNLVTSVNGSGAILKNLISKENQRKVYELSKKYDLHISMEFNINIVKSTIEDILPYFNKIGSILLLDDGVCLIKGKYAFYLIYLEGGKYIPRLFMIIFSNSVDQVEKQKEFIKEVFKEISTNDRCTMNLSWFYFNYSSNVRVATVNEELNDVFYKEAYPYLDIDKTCKEYLEGDEPVILLLGPPGTGKTRLIRYILKKMYEDRNKLSIAFTSDQNVIENSEIFITFLIDDYDALVIEDIDYHLRPRKDGNAAMYNFLTSSNSVIVNYFKKKKIILSTNLPDVNNIDDALLRPGRCYGTIETRNLINQEVKNLLKVLNKEDKNLENKHSIAEIFNSNRQRVNRKAGF